MDTDAGDLSRSVYTLIERGFEVEVVEGWDQAGHWMDVNEGRPGVLVLAAGLPAETTQRIAGSLGPRVPGGVAAMLLVGTVATRDEARKLTDLGFQWWVRTPYTPEELHLGVEAALGRSKWAEARQMPRVPVRVPVELARPGGFDRAEVLDISSGGLFLETSTALDAGTAVLVEMQLGARTMMLKGTVAHCSVRSTPGRESGAGVKFEQLAPEDERAISEFVEARLSSVRL